MIAHFPHATFQVWEYTPSHASLLIRSPRGVARPFNIDLIFRGVDYMALPHLMRGLSVDRLGDREDLRLPTLPRLDRASSVFVLSSDGLDHVVVAVSVDVNENDDDIFTSVLKWGRLGED